jgi:DNA-binding response OmpR family regulator
MFVRGHMAEIVAFPLESQPRVAVLIVDDEPVIRGFVCDHLNECGFHAQAVASGDEAARLLGKGAAIDIVFSDVQMPGTLDGYGLARWVMENRPDVPVLLASGNLGQTNAATELCGVQIVPKPYDFDLVVRRIRATLKNRVKRSA